MIAAGQSPGVWRALGVGLRGAYCFYFLIEKTPGESWDYLISFLINFYNIYHFYKFNEKSRCWLAEPA